FVEALRGHQLARRNAVPNLEVRCPRTASVTAIGVSNGVEDVHQSTFVAGVAWLAAGPKMYTPSGYFEQLAELTPGQPRYQTQLRDCAPRGLGRVLGGLSCLFVDATRGVGCLAGRLPHLRRPKIGRAH